MRMWNPPKHKPVRPSRSASPKAPITKTLVQIAIIALMRAPPGEEAVFLAGRLGPEKVWYPVAALPRWSLGCSKRPANC